MSIVQKRILDQVFDYKDSTLRSLEWHRLLRSEIVESNRQKTMPKDFPRTLRVGEQIHRELATLLRDEVKDPRIGMVTVVDVEITKDLAYARVYFTVLGEGKIIQESQEGLDSAAGFLRRELGRRMKIRTVPELHFIYDDTQRKADRVASLIDQGLAKGHTEGNGENNS